MIKKLGKILGYILLVLVVLIVVAYGVVQSSWGKTWLQNTVMELASNESQTLTMAGLQGHLPWELSIDKVTIADEQGVWLDVENAALDWNPLALLDNVVSVNAISASKIDVSRFPASQEEAPKESSRPLNIPLVLVRDISLPSISVPIGKDGEAVALEVMAGSDADTPNSLKGSLRTLGGTPTSLSYDAALDDGFSISATLQEDAGGLIAQQLGLIDSPALSATIQGQGELDAFDAAALIKQGEVAVADVTVARGEQIEISGKGTLPADIVRAQGLPADSWTLAATLEQDGDDWLLHQSDVTFSDFVAKLQGRLNDSEIVDLSQWSLKTPYATLAGALNFNLTSQAIKADANFKEVSLGTLTQDAFLGLGTGSVKAEGTPDNMQISGDVQLSELKNIPQALQTLLSNSANLTFAGRYQPSAVEIDSVAFTSGETALNVKGALPLASGANPATISGALSRTGLTPITFSSDIVQAAEAITLDKLRLATKQNELTGTLAIQTASSLIDGDVAFVSEQFNPLGKWIAAPDSEGTIDSKVILKSDGKKQHVNAVLTVDALRIPAYNLGAKNVDLQANIEDVATLQGLNAKLVIDKLISGATTINSLKFDADGARDKVNYTLAMNGRQGDSPLTVKSAGAAVMKPDSQQLTLAVLEGAFNALPYRLQKATTISHDGTRTTLTPMLMDIADGKLDVQGEVKAKSVDVTVRLTDLSLHSVLASSSLSSLKGQMDSTLTMTGNASKPLVTLKADLSIDPEIKETDPLVVALDTKWNNANARAVINNDVTFTSGDKLGYAKLALPASLSLQPFAFNLKDTASLTGDADINFPLEKLNPALKTMGHKLQGAFGAKMTIAGSVTKPKIDGKISLDKGSYDSLAFGVCLRDISLDADINPISLTLNNLEAKGDRGAGTLKGTSKIGFTRETITTALAFDDLAMFCQGIAQGKLAGNVSVDGTFSNIAAKGKMALKDMTVFIPSAGDAEIASVEHITKAELLEQKQGKQGVVKLDVSVDIDEKMMVRGRGLNAEFEGGVAISGTALKPEISGQVEAKRGRLELLGSRLTIESGVIKFLDRNPIKPYMEVQATTTADGTEIQVDLTGSVKKPALELSSTPSRPKDEVLALLLFGRPLSTISPFQALQLAKATATLAGKDNGPDMLGKLRDTIGVDSLTVNQNDAGETTVGAEKYITDRVYVGVEQGATPESRKVTTEIELTPNITAETSTNEQSGPSVGVEWRYDY